MAYSLGRLGQGENPRDRWLQGAFGEKAQASLLRRLDGLRRENPEGEATHLRTPPNDIGDVDRRLAPLTSRGTFSVSSN
jgi:hypothetical protein